MKESFLRFIEHQPYQPQLHGAVLTQQEFMQDFAHEALQARELTTAVMHFEHGLVASQIVDIFRNAPTDAQKTVMFDAYSNLVSQGTVLSPYNYLPGARDSVKSRRTDQEELISQLRETGTDVRVVNESSRIRDRVFPYTGRSHFKVSYVVDGGDKAVVYVHSHNHIDSYSAEITVKFTGEHAKKIIDEYRNLINNPPRDDYRKQLADDLWIFFDSGQPGKSIILDTAVDLTTQAEESIRMCSQLPPGGDLADALSEAYTEGKTVEVISTKRYLERPLYSTNTAMYLISAVSRLSSFIRRHVYPLFLDPYRNIHAKLLLTDVYTNNAKAFFGSHNFAKSGVRAGTQEVQFLSTDEAIVSALHRRFEDFKVTTQPY